MGIYFQNPFERMGTAYITLGKVPEILCNNFMHPSKTQFKDHLMASPIAPVYTPARKHALRCVLLTTTVLTFTGANAAFAQNHIVVGNGQTIGETTLLAGERLSVEAGGKIDATATGSAIVNTQLSTAGNIISIVNAGEILADNSTSSTRAISVSSVGITEFNNLSTGHIEGGIGVYARGGIDRFSNAGKILGHAKYAINAHNIEQFDNQSVIKGDETGLRVTGNLSNFTNSGSITGVTSYGLDLAYGDFIDGVNTGFIIGSGRGIYFRAGGQISGLKNTGRIQATNGVAIFVVDSDFVNLTNSGIISSAGATIFVDGGDIVGLRNELDGIITSARGMAIGVQDPGAKILNLTNAGGLITNIGELHSAIVALNGASIIGLTNGTLSGATSTIRGDGYGIRVEAGEIRDLVNHKGGTIQGINLAGIQLSGTGEITNMQNHGEISGSYGLFLVDDATINDLTNTGVIFGNEYGIASAQGDITDITNRGTIYGDAGGITTASNIRNLDNSGRIGAGERVAIFSSMDIINSTNSGEISVNASVGLGAVIQANGMIDDFTNTGTIKMIAANGFEAGHGIVASSLGTIINAGTILVSLNGDNYALRETVAGDTNLYIKDGSIIQGQIAIVGAAADTDSLFVENGLNLAYTFTGGTPDIVEAGHALVVVDADHVYVTDISLLANASTAFSDMTGAISGVIGDQINRGATGEGRGWWAKGFGGYTSIEQTAGMAQIRSAFGGIMGGAAGTLDNGMQLGGFAGGSFGRQHTNGDENATSSYFAGVYSRYEADSFYVNYGLSGGMTETSATRRVLNNMVDGGVEMAHSRFASYFIAPEATIGIDGLEIGGFNVNPSLTLRYGFLHSEGYTETGLSDPNDALTVGARSAHVLDARAQVALPVDIASMPSLDLLLRAGLDGHFLIGDMNIDTTISGITQSTSLDTPTTTFGGFIGASLNYAFSESTYLSANTEIGLGSGGRFTARAEVSVQMEF